MMRIGVVTYWKGNDNYGQILQAWALQYWLKVHGHDAFIIRYDFKMPVSSVPLHVRLMRYVKWLYFAPLFNRIIYRKRYKNLARNRAQIKMRAFDEFRSKYLSMSDIEYTSLDELQCNPPVADCYIAGSDQIWARPLTFYHNRAYFLDFGNDNIRRISYAPSFSMEIYPENQKKELKDLLYLFDYLSVREVSGQRICKELGYNATLVCDPTLLLTKGVYTNITSREASAKGALFVYSLNVKDPSELRWTELTEWAESSDVSIISTNASGYFEANEILSDKSKYEYCTIPQWLANIRDAQLVVTPSFHGIVFAIIMHTPFVYVPLAGEWASGNSRVTDLLSILGLKHRILYNNISYKDIIQSDIQWLDVDSRLSSFRVVSEEYLNKALS